MTTRGGAIVKELFVIILANANNPPSDPGFPVALGIGECYYSYRSNPLEAANSVFESAGKLAESRTAHVLKWGTFERVGVFHYGTVAVSV